MENSKNTPTQEQLCQQVEQAWQSRVTAQGLRGKSRRPGKSYREKQAEFFIGAMAALDFSPLLWVFSITRGDDILEERAKYQQEEGE